MTVQNTIIKFEVFSKKIIEIQDFQDYAGLFIRLVVKPSVDKLFQ